MIKDKITRNELDFWTTIQTRWSDVDGLRHINHAAYLSYMETARADLYTHLGYTMERWNQDVSTILASMRVDYLAQVNHPAILDIGQRISRVGNKSFDILTAIFKAEESSPLVQAVFTLVTFNYKKNQSITVPDNFRNYCRKM